MNQRKELKLVDNALKHLGNVVSDSIDFEKMMDGIFNLSESLVAYQKVS